MNTHDEPREPIPARALYALLLAAVFMMAGLSAEIYTVVWGVARSIPYSIEYEGHIFWACEQLSRGTNIYDSAHLAGAPWSVIIYNPLFIAIGAVLMKLTGPCFWPLRMISMAATLLSLLGMGILVKRSKVGDLQAILSVMLFATCLPVFYWSALARVDMLGLAFAIWGIERFASGWLSDAGSLRDRRYLAALALLLAAFFTKQQYLVFPLCCGLFAVSSGRKLLGIRFTLAWLAGISLLGALLQVTTGGYFAHLSYATGLPWEGDTIQRYLLPFLTDPATLAAIAIIVWGNLARAQEAPLERLAKILLLVSGALALYTMGVRGASHNHLLCTEFALFWLAALNLAKLPRWSGLPVVACGAAALVAVQGFMWHLYYQLDFQKQTTAAISLLRSSSHDGRSVLSEDPSLAMIAGGEPAIVDATTILNMARGNQQRLHALLDAIDRQSFSAIVINTHDADEALEKIWNQELVYAIKRKYRRTTTAGGNGESQSVFLPL